VSNAGLTPRAQFRGVLVFLLLLGLFNGAYQVEKRLSGRLLDLPYTRLAASGAAILAHLLLPIPVERRDSITLASGRTAVVIRGGCNGLEALFLMAAGILAYPTSWHCRGRAILIYLPILFALNLLRIVMLLYVMAEHPVYIRIFHDQIAQGILVAFVFGFWVHYVHTAQR